MNVIICGVVKNAGDKLEQNIERAIQLGERCDKYIIAIYENNSTDRTKTILERYQANPHFHIRMENIDNETIKRKSKAWAYKAVTGSDHSCRMEQISNARNNLVSEFQSEMFADYSYVVMIDLDAKSFEIDGIMTSLEMVKANRRRVIYANSLDYYDYYALRSSHSVFNIFGPELTGENFWKNIHAMPLRIRPDSTNLVSVYSAFNGIGVFDKTVFNNHRYEALVTQDVKDIYSNIALENSAAYAKFKPIIEGACPKFPGGDQDADGIFYWKNNSGYDKPVICEHVPFNFSLLKDRYQIYINPSMLYTW